MNNLGNSEWLCPKCQHEYGNATVGELCPLDGQPLLKRKVWSLYRSDPKLGSIINGRYILTDILGKGGFGTVYRCFDMLIKGEYALKMIIKNEMASEKEIRLRFIQESKALAQLDSEHIVNVYETGEADGTLYMVLELIEGLSLREHLLRQNTLSLMESARIVSQILAALEHAHAAGLIHRDLKPSNILFTDPSSTHIKLIDFGIAKLVDGRGDADPLTRTGLVIGTVQYMAPEQLRQNVPVGPSTDLYATGILFYQCLTGNPPFVGSQAEIAAGHLYHYPPHLDDEIGANEAVSNWFQTALAKEPEDRFPNAMTMRLELAQSLGTPESLLRTTLPLTNDTIRMAPDTHLMRAVLSSGFTENPDTEFSNANLTDVLSSKGAQKADDGKEANERTVDESIPVDLKQKNQIQENRETPRAPSRKATAITTTPHYTDSPSGLKESTEGEHKEKSDRSANSADGSSDEHANNRTALTDIPPIFLAEQEPAAEASEEDSLPVEEAQVAAESVQANESARTPASLTSGSSQQETPSELRPKSRSAVPKMLVDSMNQNHVRLPDEVIWWLIPLLLVISTIIYFIAT